MNKKLFSFPLQILEIIGRFTYRSLFLVLKTIYLSLVQLIKLLSLIKKPSLPKLPKIHLPKPTLFK
ncbi:MAG: hypothetical protein U9Q63_02335, partial [Patescibacteria group bacterium]|nr:hypothetical protein [Patescibacteria group bacterium]